MAGFYGKYPRQLDERGRFILPAKIREKLSGTIYIAPSPVDECLNLYSEEVWQEIAEKISSLPNVSNHGVASLQRRLFGKTMSYEVDKQGRIPLTEDLLNHAGMTKDIILIGVNSKIEIWDIDKWREVDNAYDADMMQAGISAYDITI